MAEGVVFFGVQKLWELLNRESSRLNGIDEQVEGLKRQLGRLQSLLKDADARKHESERVRNFLEDVKDIVYDAEDLIESFLLKKFKGKEKGIMRQARRLACFLVDRREFASDIEGITKRISEVIEGMQSLGIQQIIDGGRSLCLQDRKREQREIRQTFPNNTESDLVGVKQSVEELVSHLVENDYIQVVSIYGMGGIGKTTLARQVFHHDMVRCHFDGFAWVCVSQEFTRKHVWQRILQELRPHDGSILQMDEYTLQGQLFELMETGRYIVVLDDVWKEEDWDRIKPVFPQKRGWKLLLTSRNEGVGLHADPTCFAFRPRILTPHEKFRVDDEMEAMGKKMVAYCGGLPLAVKVLGGLLAKKRTVPEWKRVCDNIGTLIVGKSGLDDSNLNSVHRVLSLSYEDLPTLDLADSPYIVSAPSFQCLSLLRVLHLSRVKFEGGKMPSSIGELIHLRFLSLYKAGISHIPSSLRKLKLLYYLNLRVDVASPVHVPNVLKEMQELRYLLLPVSMHDKTKLELGDLVNLEYLWRFSTKHSSVTDLFCMTKLRELNVFITGGCNSETLSSSLHQLRDLEVLSLHDRQETHVAYHRGEIVPDCTHLKDLVLAMHMPRFPHQYGFPPYLAHIWLMHCSMEEDPMPILEKLLCLKSLVLTCGAFVGNRMVCSKGGFPQLCALKLSEQEELEEWIVEEGSMPCLRTLTIDKC
ncbi:NB-ARC [Arabidopsis suecica]|uniref:NB-ARC n=1 Tax=Arabidopsis suecica TaxID=45249 RepID=A0A8T2H195_ARASU|nr:NB-ARC [Arabidopsis suecica]